MRVLLIATLVAGFATSALADLVARNGTNELRLLNAPCTNTDVLAHIKAEWQEKFKAAQATVGRTFFHACWIDTEQGAYFIFYEDGDQSAVPVEAFINQVGI